MTRCLVALQIRVRQAMDRDHGATAVEYGLMVSLIAVAIITTVALVGTNLSTMFDKVAGKIALTIP
jgi:pilus assembly protein Flp/PilA